MKRLIVLAGLAFGLANLSAYAQSTDATAESKVAAPAAIVVATPSPAPAADARDSDFYRVEIVANYTDAKGKRVQDQPVAYFDSIKVGECGKGVETAIKEGKKLIPSTQQICVYKIDGGNYVTGWMFMPYKVAASKKDQKMLNRGHSFGFSVYSGPVNEKLQTVYGAYTVKLSRNG